MSANATASIEQVRQALARPLPGLPAMLPMIPPDRRADLYRYLTPPPCRHAGALLLLYPLAGSLHFLLTRRAESVEAHKGQISLPGGAQEDGESLQATALREAFEEVGVDPAKVEMLGSLSPVYIPPSNFYLHPFVGYMARKPDYNAFAGEVAELIEMPLGDLLEAKAVEEDWVIQGQPRRVPFYAFGPHKVWGATAMVLAEFAAALL